VAAPSADVNLADQVIEAKGLKQISDVGALEKIIDEVMAANQQSVDEYRAGKEKAFNSLVGQAMKATKGKGNPAQVNELLKKKLARLKTMEMENLAISSENILRYRPYR
jgi:aspartyl-tRNA(Asn)/glutamyl-tRNA(Gln) amidotransferase subunit B